MASPEVEGLDIKRLTFMLVLVLALGLVGDAPAGGISDQPCPNVAGEHTNTCPPGKLGAAYSIRFVESEGSGCGPGRQTFHFDSGVLPPGLSLAPDGRLTGTPSQLGTFQFYVEMREPSDDPAHCAGKRTQKQFTLRICNDLAVATSPPVTPPSEVGVRFRMRLSYCGGMGALTWTVPAGALPAGLALRRDGTIAGAPRAAGTYRFTATATDAVQRAANYVGTIAVAPALRVRTQRVPPAEVGRSYTVRLGASGGVAPTVWKVKHGALPPGLRLDPAHGVLRGMPRMAGERDIVFEVRDELGVRATRKLSLVIRKQQTRRGVSSRARVGRR